MPQSNDFDSKNEHKKLLDYFHQVNKKFLKLDQSLFGTLENEYSSFLNYSEVLSKVKQQVLEIRKDINEVESKINNEVNYDLKPISYYTNLLEVSLVKLELFKKKLEKFLKIAKKDEELMVNQFNSLPSGFHEFFSLSLKEKILEVLHKINYGEEAESVKSGFQFFLDQVQRGKDVLYIKGKPVSHILKSKCALSFLVKKLIRNSINSTNSNIEKAIENFANKNGVDLESARLAIKGSLDDPDLMTVFSVDGILDIFRENFKKYKIENCDDNVLKRNILEIFCDLYTQNESSMIKSVILGNDSNVLLYEKNVGDVGDEVLKEIFLQFIQELDELNDDISPEGVVLKACKEVFQKRGIYFTDQLLEELTFRAEVKEFKGVKGVKGGISCLEEVLNIKEMSKIFGELFKENKDSISLKEDFLEYILRIATQGGYPYLFLQAVHDLFKEDKKIEKEDFKRAWDFYNKLFIPSGGCGDLWYYQDYNQYKLNFFPNADGSFKCIVKYYISVYELINENLLKNSSFENLENSSFDQFFRSLGICDFDFQLESVMVSKLENDKIISQLEDCKLDVKFNEEGIKKGFFHGVKKIIDDLINFVKNIINSLQKNDYASKKSFATENVHSLDTDVVPKVSEKDSGVIETSDQVKSDKKCKSPVDLRRSSYEDSGIGSDSGRSSLPFSDNSSRRDSFDSTVMETSAKVKSDKKYKSQVDLRRSSYEDSEIGSDSGRSSLPFSGNSSRRDDFYSTVIETSAKVKSDRKSKSLVDLRRSSYEDSEIGSDSGRSSLPFSGNSSRRDSFNSTVMETSDQVKSDKKCKSPVDLRRSSYEDSGIGSNSGRSSYPSSSNVSIDDNYKSDYVIESEEPAFYPLSINDSERDRVDSGSRRMYSIARRSNSLPNLSISNSSYSAHANSQPSSNLKKVFVEDLSNTQVVCNRS